MLRAELFFGRALKAGGSISDAAWAAFLARDVTPRFPQGLTVLDGAGQWRNKSGRIVRERSKVLVIIAPERPDVSARLDAIVETYKRQFRQESVGVALARVCATF